MGSALSLYNTTPNTWQLKIMLTTWNWAQLPAVAQSVVAFINASLRAAGSQLRLTPNNQSTPSNTVFVMSGMTPAVLRGMLVMANLPATASWASAFVVIASNYITSYEGCTSVPRGGSLRREGATLSLIHRGVGYRNLVDPSNAQQVTMHLLVMHPIFSGPTAGSTNVYHMQAWINENHLDAGATIRLDAAGLSAVSNAAMQALDEADVSMSIDWEQEFTRAREHAKQAALKEAGKDHDAGICEPAGGDLPTN